MFDTYVLGQEFVRRNVDHYVYYKQVGKHFVYVALYVDDMLFIVNNMEVFKEVKTQLSSKFDMKDLGATNFILGMEIKINHANMKLWLNKRKHVNTILHRFNMKDCKPIQVSIPIGERIFGK